MTKLLTRMQRSLLKLGSDIADIFLPAAIGEGSPRPIPGYTPPDMGIRWTSRDCFDCFYSEAGHHPANANWPLAAQRAVARQRRNGARFPTAIRLIAIGSLDLPDMPLPGGSGIGPILVDNPIGPGAPSPDRLERAPETALPSHACKPKPAVPP